MTGPGLVSIQHIESVQSGLSRGSKDRFFHPGPRSLLLSSYVSKRVYFCRSPSTPRRSEWNVVIWPVRFFKPFYISPSPSFFLDSDNSLPPAMESLLKLTNERPSPGMPPPARSRNGLIRPPFPFHQPRSFLSPPCLVYGPLWTPLCEDRGFREMSHIRPSSRTSVAISLFLLLDCDHTSHAELR